MGHQVSIPIYDVPIVYEIIKDGSFSMCMFFSFISYFNFKIERILCTEDLRPCLLDWLNFWSISNLYYVNNTQKKNVEIKTESKICARVYSGNKSLRRIGAPIERLTHASERNIRSVKCVCTQHVLLFRG